MASWSKSCSMLFAGAVLTLAGIPAHAEEKGLSGLWLMPPHQPRRPPPELTEAGKKLNIADRQGAGPMAKQRCLPVGIPRMYSNELPLEIIESPERIGVIGEQAELARTIYLNTDKHPNDIQPTWNGNSYGKWVDGVLVVHVAGFNDRTSHILGVNKGSATTQITEKYKVVEGGKGLVIEMTFEDPNVLAKPYTASIHYDRLPAGSQRWEYVCDVEDPLWNTALGFDPNTPEKK